MTFASVWESRNSNTSAMAAFAPANRALIKPSLSRRRMIFTLGRFFFTYSSNFFFKNAEEIYTIIVKHVKFSEMLRNKNINPE